MNGIFAAAAEVQRFLKTKRWRFAIIGGIAVLRWGEPYATQDVDVSLLCGFGNEEQYIDGFLAAFPARVGGAREFALANRVVLARASNGVAIDLVLTGIPYEEKVIARATDFAFAPEAVVTTCSAEDLIVLKAFAGRPKDWAAVRGVLARQGGRLDWAYVEEHLALFCELKGEPELMQQLLQIRDELEQGPAE